MNKIIATLLVAWFFHGVFDLAPAYAQKAQHVRIALSTPTPHMAPLWVGRDKKLFEKYGLDVQLILVNSGSLVAQMFQSGEIQMTANAPASLVSLAAAGEKLSFFLGLSNTSPFTLMTQPNLRRAEELRGKRIGTARFGGSSHISALIALEHLGLDLKRDKIILVQTGVDPDRMVALENKAIDGAMLQLVATKVMTAKGYYQLLNMHKSKIPYQNTGLTIKKITASPIPKPLMDLRAASLKRTDIFSRKKTNKPSKKSLLAISACPMLMLPKTTIRRRKKNSTENLIPLWRDLRSSSSMSPNKIPKPGPSRLKKSSIPAGSRGSMAKGFLKKRTAPSSLIALRALVSDLASARQI